jgi:hypothetical protein
MPLANMPITMVSPAFLGKRKGHFIFFLSCPHHRQPLLLRSTQSMSRDEITWFSVSPVTKMERQNCPRCVHSCLIAGWL